MFSGSYVILGICERYHYQRIIFVVNQNFPIKIWIRLSTFFGKDYSLEMAFIKFVNIDTTFK